MAKNVQLPNGETAEFPDSMSDEAIASVLAKQFSAKPEAAPEKSVSGFFGNVMKDAVENFKPLVTNPIGALASMFDFGMTPAYVGTSAPVNPIVDRAKRLVDVEQNYKDTYNRNPLDTLYEKPVRVASDLSLLLGAGGAVTPGRAGALMAAGAEKVNPMNVPITVLKALPDSLVTPISRFLYGGAVKPSTGLDNAKRDALLDAGIKEGILPTKGGLDKLRNILRQGKEDVDARVKQLSEEGATVDPNKVVTALDDVRQKNITTNPEAPQRAITKAEVEFLLNHPENISLDLAQILKRNTQASLKKTYGKRATPKAEANKALARKLKEEIAAADDTGYIADVNKRLSPLIDLKKEINRTVGREGNKRLLGLATPVTGLLANAFTHDPALTALLTGTAAVAEHPPVRAGLGIGLGNPDFLVPKGGPNLLNLLMRTGAEGENQ